MSDVLRAAAKNVQTRTGLYDIENIIRREQAAKTLAIAYLAEHPEDDDADITVAWLIGCTFYQNLGGDSFRLGVFLVIYLKWDDKGAPHWTAEVAGGMNVPVSTRGDVRRLCKALGIPLTEPTP